MKKTEYIAKMGLMLALLCALSFLESRICAAFPHGVRIGLANIVIMLSMFSINFKSAFTLSILKAFFVFITRGSVAFFMSLSGGIVSIIVIFLLSSIKKPSITLCSIFGAIFHNLAQITVSALILKSLYTFYYAPILVLSGICAGILTGLCLCAIAPYFSNHKKHIDQ